MDAQQKSSEESFEESFFRSPLPSQLVPRINTCQEQNST